MGSDGFLTVFYVGNDRIGEVRVLPQPQSPSPSPRPQQSPSPPQSPSRQSRLQQMFPVEMRATRLSQPSQRCLPLAVLHTLSLDGVWFKLEPATVAGDHNRDSYHDSYCDTDRPTNQLQLLHSSCLNDAKTAVVPIDEGTNELHLVAMKSNKGPCFWAFCTPRGLYDFCLAMLNLRCLAMVFDLDETLILANTQRSFEDRIEALRVKIHAEKLKMGKMDGQRVANMAAELERYQRDRLLLKQFADNDFVVLDNGRVIRAQMEEVPAHFEGAPPVWRPVIRIPEKNIIFTRIHPNVRDTSILVKIRPAWEELRNYVLARGRKRFEVFICTMSEKDYALEMWRLLDPDARLVDSKQLLLRLLCVKAGSKKSLTNMFQYAPCHRKMAMVIDDRPDVWEEEDQQQVHVVPAFSPYYAPGAETNAPMPILCIARNVASNVRGGFFKDFDETLTQKLSEINYGSDVSTLPTSPHVGTYLSEMAPNDSTVSLGLRYSPKPFPDGMTGSEVNTALEPQLQPNGASVFNAGQVQYQSHDISTGPATDGGWLEDEDETCQDSPSSRNPEVNTNYNNSSLDLNSGFSQMENRSTTRWPGAPQSQDEESPSSRRPEFENVHIRSLQELAHKCNASVEYKCAVNATTELLFTYEVYFEGNRVGRGVARTSREAKVTAAQEALKFLERPRFPGRPSAVVRETDAWNSRSSQDEVSPAASTSGKEPEDRKTIKFDAVAALKTLCSLEGLKVDYLERPTLRGIYNCEVEVSGRVLGKGSGQDWESAKHQAAEQAMRQLNSSSTNSSNDTSNNTCGKRNLPKIASSPSFHGKRMKFGDAWRPPTPSTRGTRPPTRQWGRTPSFRR